MLDKHAIARTLRRAPWAMRLAVRAYSQFRTRYTGGAVGVVVNTRGEILVVEHVYHPATPWGLPGGWVDGDEQPAAAAAREIWEELGLRVEVGRVVVVERTQPRHWDSAFLCRPVGEIEALCNELLAYQWCAPDQLPRLTPFHTRAIAQTIALLNGQLWPNSQNVDVV